MTDKAPANSQTASRNLLSRRAAMTLTGRGVAVAVSLPALAMAETDDVSDLIRAAEGKNAAFMRGDMETWAAATEIAPEFTLMQPFGGMPSRGLDKNPARLAQMSKFFRNGRTSLEIVQTLASGDLAILVMIERQQAEVGGLPDQDWSLRVTEIYRKAGGRWQLAHRHADPLTHRLSLQQSAGLARGDVEKRC